MAMNWFYPEIDRWSVSGLDVVEDNFNNEEKAPFNIFLRELIQNSLDARSCENVGPVVISIREKSDFKADIFDREFFERLAVSENNQETKSLSNHCLLIEDFNTTGLAGKTDNPNELDEGENWNGFWWREGEGAKSGRGSNGSAGQGKITFYRMSGVRSLIGYTVRKSDGKALMMGRTHFSKDYFFNSQRYRRHSWWTSSGKKAIPLDQTESKEEFEKYLKLFGFKREIRQPGLSLLIPFTEPVDMRSVLLSLVGEFYYTIKKQRLRFEINISGKDIIVTHETIDKLAAEIKDEEIRDAKSVFTEDMRSLTESVLNIKDSDIIEASESWVNDRVLSKDCFKEKDLNIINEKFLRGEIVSVRFPVIINLRKEKIKRKSDFHVFVHSTSQMLGSEEAYIRKDLVIGLEKHLAGAGRLQPARSITLVSDEELSAFLSAAEEPTHLKWNSKRKKLINEYVSSADLLNAVRNAAPRLLALLSGEKLEKDKKALAAFFPKPVVYEAENERSQGRKAGGNNKLDRWNLPNKRKKTVSIPAPVVVEDVLGGVLLKKNPDINIKSIQPPFSCKLEFGYVWCDGSDPFTNYHPLDFDLQDEKIFSISHKDVEIKSRFQNVVEFLVKSGDFKFEITGFDLNLRIKSKLDIK